MYEKRDVIVCQGRELREEDIRFIKKLIALNPRWLRTKISKELCRLWDWYTPYGQMKDMACRTMLTKLEQAGLINLPPSQIKVKRQFGINSTGQFQFEFDNTPLILSIKEVLPVRIEIAKTKNEIAIFKNYLIQYHYLGLRTVVGENMKYMVYAKNGQPLACLLFGAAAWKTAPREAFIGWESEERKKNLGLIANNSRFLVFPWVNIPHLASHILSKIAKRISNDWEEKYKHPIYLLETFVEKRFKGTCYRAANWRYLGETQGRGKKDRYFEYSLPVKSIWVYPLCKYFKDYLKK
jgi:hypothetical protein